MPIEQVSQAFSRGLSSEFRKVLKFHMGSPAWHKLGAKHRKRV